MLWGKKFTWIISLHTKMRFKDYLYWECQSLHRANDAQPNIGYSVGGRNTQWRIADVTYVERWNRLKRAFFCDCVTDTVDLSAYLATPEYREDPYAERFPQSNLWGYYCPQLLEEEYAHLIRNGWSRAPLIRGGYGINFDSGDGSFLVREEQDRSYTVLDPIGYGVKKFAELPEWVR